MRNLVFNIDLWIAQIPDQAAEKNGHDARGLQASDRRKL